MNTEKLQSLQKEYKDYLKTSGDTSWIENFLERLIEILLESSQ